MRAIREASREIQRRLDSSGDWIVGYNCCWGLMLVYSGYLDPDYKKPEWIEDSYKNPIDLVKDIMNNTNSKSIKDATISFLEYNHYNRIDHLGGTLEGDVIIRRVPQGLQCSIVDSGKTEISVSPLTRRVESMSLPLFDQTILCIGRKKT